MRKAILKSFDQINNALLTISAVFLLTATLLSVINAIIRFADLGGITWTEELSTLLMILLVYLAQPQLEFRKKQLTIGILQSALKSKLARQILNIVQGVIIMAITGFVLFYCFRVFGNAAKYNFITSVLHIPRTILFGCMIVAYITVIISWLVTIFANHGNTFGGDEIDLGVVDQGTIDAQVKTFSGHQGTDTEDKSIGGGK